MTSHKFFGTDGIRGKYGSQAMNRNLAYSLGLAVGEYLASQGKKGRTVIIGRDPRASGKELREACIAGLASFNLQVLDVGMVPTPCLAFSVLELKASMGVMITASHNPHVDNGLKLFSSSGSKLSIETEREIENLIKLQDCPNQISHKTESVDLSENYLRHVSDYFDPDFLQGKSVVIDTANGASSKISPLAFARFGAEVTCINNGDGIINENSGSEHVESLQQKVRSTNAWLGVAHDGDADRAVFIDCTGKKISGDKILGLIARHAMEKKQLNGNGFVATIHSNSGLGASLKNLGLDLYRSQVGDRNVSTLMLEKGCNLGGESSGHVLFHDYLLTGDGLFTALFVANALREKGGTLEEISHWVELWPSRSKSLDVRKKTPLEECLPLQDALKLNREMMGEEGRILLRYSGTEPKIRLLVEAKSEKLVDQVFDSMRAHVEKLL